MPPIASPKFYLLLSVAYSHYNEKARWAFSYYRVSYTHHLLLPMFHIFSVKPILERGVCSQETRDTKSSPFSTPCLAVYDASGSQLEESFHDSHDILVYLSENFSSPDHVNLYTSCGPSKENEIVALERHYDEVLGVAARDFLYYDMLVVNKWRAMLPFALMGFKNHVGLLQSLPWFFLSQLLGRMIMSAMEMTESKYQEAIQICREEFKHASEVLEKSDYLAGSRLSVVDITFAALSLPFLGITHQEGYQLYPPSSSARSPQAKVLMDEMRATRAGQHVLRLYKEERYFGTSLPKQKKAVLGLW